jgi:hypothetical protein
MQRNGVVVSEGSEGDQHTPFAGVRSVTVKGLEKTFLIWRRLH